MSRTRDVWCAVWCTCVRCLTFFFCDSVVRIWIWEYLGPACCYGRGHAGSEGKDFCVRTFACLEGVCVCACAKMMIHVYSFRGRWNIHVQVCTELSIKFPEIWEFEKGFWQRWVCIVRCRTSDGLFPFFLFFLQCVGVRWMKWVGEVR